LKSSKKEGVFVRESQWKTCSYGSLHFTVLVVLLEGTSRTLCTPKEIRDQHLKDRICTAIETVMPEMLS